MRLLFQQEAFGSRDGAVQEMHGGEPEESQSSIPEDGENVSERKYVVPDGMLEAAVDAAVKFSGANTIQASPRVKAEIEESFRVAIEAAIRWLAENPIVPKTFDELPTVGYLIDSSTWGTKGKPEYEQKRQENYLDGMKRLIAEWQRRMFLAPEPEFIGNETVAQFCCRFQTIREAAIEAYRIGHKTSS